MNTIDDDAIIPPEWVPLSVAPNWIDRIYDVSGGAVRRELILAVREKLHIPHRVLCKLRTSSTRILPSGFVYEWSWGVQCVFVTDWELAEADWKSCTVGGWKNSDETRERLPIEVPWKWVDSFVRPRLRGWKRETADAPLSRTGAAGRPSSLANLVAPELMRRALAGETLATIKDEAQALSTWLAENHPKQPQIKPKAIENSLRAQLWAAVRSAQNRGI
jgi:hypothetical protein